jgi:ATP-dependent RNA helicase DDX54/DBP10
VKMTDSVVKKPKIKPGSFQSLNLEKEILQGILRMGYKEPTPVQRKALPVVLAGVDAVCMARTGSGKTCVFLLPMMQKLRTHNVGGVRGIVLSPTRELAVQTYKFACDMAKFTDLRIISILGGDSIQSQFDGLASKPDVIIATPGRLMHLLHEVPSFRLSTIKYLVFDEADRLFEMGFAEQLNEIVKQCPSDRQTLLFSATLPKMIVQFSRAGLKDPQLIRLDTDIKMSDELRLAFFLVRSNEKIATLIYFIRNIIPKNQQTIIFTATRHHSELLYAVLNKLEVSCAMIYGNMDQDLRTNNLKMFRHAEVNFLIVTDVAARGIDVPLLNNVINFHFSPAPKLFVHRCGRAARQGRTGFAFSFIEPDEMAYMADVHRFLGKDILTGYPSKDKSHQEALRKLQEERNAGQDIVKNEENENETQAPEKMNFSEEDDDKYSYNLSTMTPDMFHTGLIPQDAIDEENDFVKRLLEEDDALATLYRIAENGFKQYKRTRSDASHEGAKDAKKVIKSDFLQTIHPLIKGCDPKRCSKETLMKAEYIRMLQTFRPHATVFETGIGTGSTSHMSETKKAEKQKKSLEVMKEFRKSNQFFLERNKKKLTDSKNEVKEEDGEEDDEEGNKNNDWDALENEQLGDDNDEYGNNNYDDQINRSEDEEDNNQSIAGESYIAPIRHHKRLSAAERKKLKKQGTLPLRSGQNEEDENIVELPSSNNKNSSNYQDKFYMNYGNESNHETFAEETLQPLSNLRSGETFGNIS